MNTVPVSSQSQRSVLFWPRLKKLREMLAGWMTAGDSSARSWLQSQALLLDTV